MFLILFLLSHLTSASLSLLIEKMDVRLKKGGKRIGFFITDMYGRNNENNNNNPTKSIRFRFGISPNLDKKILLLVFVCSQNEIPKYEKRSLV